MIITDNFNHRRILRTVTVELSEPENIKQNKVASILYHYADLHRGLFPFVQEMILHQDISIYPLQKPFHDQSLVKFYAIKAALTEPIARQFANGSADILQAQFITFIDGLISDYNITREDFISPIVVIENSSADKFNLVQSTTLK